MCSWPCARSCCIDLTSLVVDSTLSCEIRRHMKELLAYTSFPRREISMACSCLAIEKRAATNRHHTYWRHSAPSLLSWPNMKTSWHGINFRITGPLWGESTGHRWIPLAQGQSCGAMIFFFDVSMNKLFNKQSTCRRFPTLCDGTVYCGSDWCKQKTTGNSTAIMTESFCLMTSSAGKPTWVW